MRPGLPETAPGFERPARGLKRFSARIMGRAVGWYTAALGGLLRRRSLTAAFMLFSFGLLAFSIFVVFPRIPREIISAPQSDRIVMFFRSPTVDEPGQVVEEKVPEVERRVREQIGPFMESSYADVFGRWNRYFVNLTDSRRADEAVALLQKEFVSDNTWYYNVMMWDPAQLPLPRTMDLQVSVHGPDPVESVMLLERIRDLVNETELYGWVFTDPPTGLSDELSMTAREQVIAGFPGLSEDSLVRLVRTVLGGTAEVEFEEEQNTVEVAAVYPEPLISGRENLSEFLIPWQGSVVPLKHFFDFSETTSLSGIASENGERIFRLYGHMPPDAPESRRLELEGRIREEIDRNIDIPAGYSVVFDNPQEEMDEAISTLFAALAASVVLIYLLLAFQFNSLVLPLVILVTVPLGFIGVVFSLYLFNSTVSLNSMLGTILLAGIVVNNGILMIDFYLKVARSPDRVQAIVDTAGLRFTPIVITMLTTVFGMLPLAIGLGEGSNIVQPLGIAVSGGLVVSTLFTLFMVPCILNLMRTS
jgi:multidrug efflux pump subunit AcrB